MFVFINEKERYHQIGWNRCSKAKKQKRIEWSAKIFGLKVGFWCNGINNNPRNVNELMIWSENYSNYAKKQTNKTIQTFQSLQLSNKQGSNLFVIL